MQIDKNLKRPRVFQQILNGQPSHIYTGRNIINMRIMFYMYGMSQKLGKNQSKEKFVLLKVASDKKFGQHFP